SSLARAAARSCGGVNSSRVTATAAPMRPSLPNRHRAHRISLPAAREDTGESVPNRVGIRRPVPSLIVSGSKTSSTQRRRSYASQSRRGLGGGGGDLLDGGI